MPCPDGTYPLPFLSILSNLDITHDFYYSESLFDHPATEYDHQLAFVTLGMVMAAFTAAVSIPQYWVNGSVGREANLAAAYELLGFGDAPFLQLRHRHRQGRGFRGLLTGTEALHPQRQNTHPRGPDAAGRAAMAASGPATSTPAPPAPITASRRRWPPCLPPSRPI